MKISITFTNSRYFVKVDGKAPLRFGSLQKAAERVHSLREAGEADMHGDPELLAALEQELLAFEPSADTSEPPELADQPPVDEAEAAAAEAERLGDMRDLPDEALQQPPEEPPAPAEEVLSDPPATSTGDPWDRVKFARQMLETVARKKGYGSPEELVRALHGDITDPARMNALILDEAIHNGLEVCARRFCSLGDLAPRALAGTADGDGVFTVLGKTAAGQVRVRIVLPDGSEIVKRYSADLTVEVLGTATRPVVTKEPKAKEPKASGEVDGRLPPVGTEIRVARKDGRSWLLTVLEGGRILHEGQEYKSISGAAVAITGKPVNGFVWAGLVKRGKKAA